MAAVFLLASSGPLSAQSVDALLVQDTFVKNTFLEEPPPLRTHYLTVNQKHSGYLQFSFDSVLPAGTTAEQINRAVLRIFVAFNLTKLRPPSGGQDPAVDVPGLRVYGLTQPFREDAKDGPSQRDPAHTAEAAILDKNLFVDLDVTPLVRAWIAKARPNYGFALAGEEAAASSGSNNAVPGDFRIPTKENPANTREARLLLVVRPATPTP